MAKAELVDYWRQIPITLVGPYSTQQRFLLPLVKDCFFTAVVIPISVRRAAGRVDKKSKLFSEEIDQA